MILAFILMFICVTTISILLIVLKKTNNQEKAFKDLIYRYNTGSNVDKVKILKEIFNRFDHSTILLFLSDVGLEGIITNMNIGSFNMFSSINNLNSIQIMNQPSNFNDFNNMLLQNDQICIMNDMNAMNLL